MPYDLAIQLLGIYPKELKVGTQILYINIHSSINHNSLNKKKAEITQVSINRWINYLSIYTYNGILCRNEQEWRNKHNTGININRNEVWYMLVWINPDNTLNEITKIQRANIVWFHLHIRSRICKFTETDHSWELGEERMGSDCVMGTKFLFRGWKSFRNRDGFML